MGRDLLQDKARAKVAESIDGNLNQLSSAAAQVVAVTGQLVAARAKVLAGVVAGEFDQADVDKIDELTPKVAAFKAAADKYLE